MSSSARYSSLSIVLHWLIAAAMIFMIILGWRMGEQARGPSTFALFQLHKSLGISILVLSLVRLGWRLAKPPPTYTSPLGTWERRLSHLVHIGFYAAMILLPLSGWLLISTSKTQIPTLLYGAVPWPNLPGFAAMTAEARNSWNEGGEAVHGLVAKLLSYGLIPLHLAGVLKHQLVNRDDIAARMIPGARVGARLSPAFWAPFAGLVAVVVAAYSIFPPNPAEAVGKPEAAESTDSPAAAAAATRTQAPTEAGPVMAADLPEGQEVTPPPLTTQAAPAEPVSTKAAPSNWAVTKGSRLGFRTAWSGSAIDGSFSKWTADIHFSPDALDRSRVTVRIDMGSVTTGDGQRDGSLVSDDWFATARHPTAQFTASRFAKTGPDLYEARGQLSLRGVSRPVTLPFRLKIEDDTARLTGTTSLDRTQFGVGQGEWSATDQIPAKVSIDVDLTAQRQP